MVLEWTLKTTVLLALAALLTLLMRRRSAAARHLVWSLGLAGALLVPPLSLVAPEWQLPGGMPPIAAAEWRLEVRPQPALPTVVSDAALASQAVLGSLSPTRPISQERREMTAAIRFDPRDWLLPIWLSGASLVLGIIALGLWRVRALRRNAQPLTWGPVAALVAELLGRLDVRRPVTVLRTQAPCMPMTWGSLRPVVLLPSDAERWPADRLRAVLLHELAHVKRHDYGTQLMARLACAVYWFNPLVWIAARRLRVERELACDDLVLAAGSRASEYAGHLLEVARSLHVSPVTAVATIAMARPSQLANRLLAVLDAGRPRGMLTPRLAAAATMVTVLVVLPLAGASPRSVEAQAGAVVAAAPASQSIAAASASSGPRVRDVAAAPPAAAAKAAAAVAAAISPIVLDEQVCDWQSRRNTSASHNVNDDETRIRIRAGDCELRVHILGQVEFTADDTEVASLSRDASFEIEEREGRSSRRLVVERAEGGGGGGGLERRWWVNGERREYDAAARAWLAQMLPVVFRRTGLTAKARATRILEQGGVDALVREISLIPSDWAARQYFSVALSRRELSPETLGGIVRQAGQEIGSDFELAELLITVAKEQPLEESVRAAYVEATGSIGSDFERRRALTAVLDREPLSQDLADAMIRMAVEINSDFELAELLIRMARARPPGRPLTPAFFDAARSLSSDFERKRVLLASLERDPGPPAVAAALEATTGMSSDFERAELLVAVARQAALTDATRPSFFRALAEVRSDFEHARVLKQVTARTPLPEATVLAVLESAAGISSDFELAEVLIVLARSYKVDDRTRPAFLKAAESIGSEFERGRVLSALFPRSIPAER